MTRIFLEAHRRDEAASAAAVAAAQACPVAGSGHRPLQLGGRLPKSPMRSVGHVWSSEPQPPRSVGRGEFTSAFFNRFYSYAEWMVVWHVQLLDARHALVRLGTAEDVLAWGTRRAAGGRGFTRPLLSSTRAVHVTQITP
jgi:hypothetical protein